ncbi:hypothetical protein NQ318_002385 [Aromia moschata]|uniref:Uncharacterized protein n=1 Tax=Aromia moschata TaxID=1265417 RepID=A0AAV8YE39_9CUCU|nr:hypothetical protein NQ318_002385 [Aromia moschata]
MGLYNEDLRCRMCNKGNGVSPSHSLSVLLYLAGVVELVFKNVYLKPSIVPPMQAYIQPVQPLISGIPPISSNIPTFTSQSASFGAPWCQAFH